MANNISSNPWYVNVTPFSYTLSYVYVKDIIWSSYSSGTLTITDRNGNIIVSSTVTAAGPAIRFGPFGWVNGLIVTSVSSGNVSIPITKG